MLSVGALELLEALLSIDPKRRPSAKEALQFHYFTKEEPIACPPSEYVGFMVFVGCIESMTNDMSKDFCD
jgi:hypothetical protein